MRMLAHRRTVAAVVGLAATAAIATGCASTDKAKEAASGATAAAGSVLSSAVVAPASSAVATASSAVESATASAEDIKLKGAQGRDVTLTGPIAVKYAAATDAQKKDLGAPLDGDRNAGTRDSGVVFQQFEGGVIVAKNDKAGTPAHIVWGKIRDAWNVERTDTGQPTEAADGKNGSAGPLGIPTTDEETDGDLKSTTFEHGKITFDSKTGKVTVVVKGVDVPSGVK